jgi:hypothetical protein
MSSIMAEGDTTELAQCTSYSIRTRKIIRGEGHRCIRRTIVLRSLTKMIGKVVNKVRANMDSEI